MTRFWLPLDEGVELVFEALRTMRGGETYVAKVPSMKIVDLAKAVAPEAEIEEIGIRPGEKLHEIMITEDDSLKTYEHENYFIIYPQYHWWSSELHFHEGGKKVSDRFRYSSDNNTEWMSVEEIKKHI
jgi:FlaA1/EpsC-like NDP-sugar epimerase